MDHRLRRLEQRLGRPPAADGPDFSALTSDEQIELYVLLTLIADGQSTGRPLTTQEDARLVSLMERGTMKGKRSWQPGPF